LHLGVHNRQALAQWLIFWTGNRNNESPQFELERDFHNHNKDEHQEEEDRNMAEFDKAHSEDHANLQESGHCSLSMDGFRLEAAKTLIDRQGTAVVG
jgi:hypothetical protein